MHGNFESTAWIELALFASLRLKWIISYAARVNSASKFQVQICIWKMFTNNSSFAVYSACFAFFSLLKTISRRYTTSNKYETADVGKSGTFYFVIESTFYSNSLLNGSLFFSSANDVGMQDQIEPWWNELDPGLRLIRKIVCDSIKKKLCCILAYAHSLTYN